MTEWLLFFALGAILMEAGMGRAKGTTHCFVKGLAALGVGAFIGAVGGNERNALLCGTVALLASIGLGDRVTLIASVSLAAAIGGAHRLLVFFDRAIGLAVSHHLPEPFTALAPVRDWLSVYWLPDYASLWSVHALAGGAALGMLMVTGPRIGRYTRNGASAAMPAHNLPLAGIGAFLLWVGSRTFSPPLWQAATYGAFAALLSSLIWTKWRFGKTDPSFAFTAFWAGLISGLASGSAAFVPSVSVGIVSGIVAVSLSLALDKRFVDDPVGIVAAEGIAPLLGLTTQWLSLTKTFGVGAVSWAIGFSFGFAVSQIVGRLLWELGILRPAPSDELAGVDQRLYGIAAYPEFELREA